MFLSKQFKTRLDQSVIVPIILFGCETLMVRKVDEQRLMVSEKKILGRIFGLVQGPKTRQWRIEKI